MMQRFARDIGGKSSPELVDSFFFPQKNTNQTDLSKHKMDDARANELPFKVRLSLDFACVQ